MIYKKGDIDMKNNKIEFDKIIIEPKPYNEYDYKEFVRQFKEKYGVVLKSKRSNGK